MWAASMEKARKMSGAKQPLKASGGPISAAATSTWRETSTVLPPGLAWVCDATWGKNAFMIGYCNCR